MTQQLKCAVSILEINVESYDMAIEYATDGVLGDVEDFVWLEKFKDTKFDYILFADVLEHLRDPNKVLKMAKELLKNDGRIIISIPNFAYIGVLEELNINKFKCCNTSILDNTHTHMLSYESICEMFSEHNLTIEKSNAIYLPMQYSEFSEIADKIPERLLYILEKKFFLIYTNLYLL